MLRSPQTTSHKKVTWPHTLKTALKMHLNCIQTDQKMPLIEETPPNSVLTILTKASEAMLLQSTISSTSKFPSETINALTDFVLDLFEQCCLCNLLTLEERRTFQFIVMGKQTLTGRHVKKRRTEEVAQTQLHSRLVYAPVLTVEYLLRLIAALPVLVHHYQVLCSGSTASRSASAPVEISDADGCEPLWLYVNSVLRYIEQNVTVLTPLSKYASFVDE